MSKKYWESRSVQREMESQLIASKYLARMDESLREAQEDILKQIDTFYARYAKDNKVSLSEARKYLTAKELKDFKNIDLKRFREMSLAGNPEYDRILNATSYRARISRLEALNMQIEMRMVELYGGANGLQEYTYTGLTDVYNNSYYRTMHDLHKTGTIIGVVAATSDSSMKEILSYNWSGKEFSKRIWGHQAATRQSIQKELERSFASGRSLQRTTKSIMDITNVSRSRAEALVRTESNFFHGLAAQNSYVDAGIERYEILSTLDSRTSNICREQDGKIYKTKDYKPGETAPPFHVRCRTTTIPYFDESVYMVGEKRQSSDGLIDSMSYEEWYNESVLKPKQEAERIENEKRQSLISQIQSDIKGGEYKLQHSRNHFDKHNPAHKRYLDYVERNAAKGKQKPSHLIVSYEEADELVEKYAGTGEIKLTKSGKWNNKELIISQETIGVHVDQGTGKETPTNAFFIHYGKSGTHIIPTLK
ncbi:minor capsid protein [Cytobacillus purgationiresistens]|uniref:SPP1 gp7 family putative phage head morphogenesis protein n=1 Tax=Cytobacillus purgationiresistens TaxID=863449 RepID=A0ABU0AFB2_9BACI|nr:minor capsid protein [Cytobacillus purgationiresistens]MDQ0269949.1 SPP1 gp7 family putative phage head morphogenesis protein [Cytobacillus purgationiresistens]